MPLLTSPIDGSPMQQIKRFGIELDVCPTSGGVWLDKGELEKIITMIKQASEEEARAFQNQKSHSKDYDDYQYKGKPSDSKYRGKRKKEGMLENLMDIFDF